MIPDHLQFTGVGSETASTNPTNQIRIFREVAADVAAKARISSGMKQDWLTLIAKQTGLALEWAIYEEQENAIDAAWRVTWLTILSFILNPEQENREDLVTNLQDMYRRIEPTQRGIAI